MAAACSREERSTVQVQEDQPTTGLPATQSTSSPPTGTGSSIQSPYLGQETRKIKALSPEDIEGLLTGAGTPFGGMAKPAELNGYPGPRHVLDAVESGELKIGIEQLRQIESLYDEMRLKAIELGQIIVELEEAIDTAFASRTITKESLREKISKSVDLYGRLRIVHLGTHLAMVDILTPQQVAQYNLLRGYSSGGDPCRNVPVGHNPTLWKMHNNCQ